jgi:predicted short-subunit dehydrogenase-like oxidoreductase (DUF2520 family)
MKSHGAMGLVSAGGASQSFLARWPEFRKRLGPVKAASFQLSRRIVNQMRAGYAVSAYSALELCPVIWITGPESRLDAVIRELAAQTPIDRTMIVLCGSLHGSSRFAALQKTSARIATLNAIQEGREAQWHEYTFVGEGHPETLRVIRRMLAADGRKLYEVRPGAKALYLASVHLATNLLLPWIAMSVESLRAAGLSRADSTHIAAALAQRAVRAYTRAGRKAWNQPAAAALRHALANDLERIRAADPRWAALYSDGIRGALAYFGSGGAGEEDPPRAQSQSV